MVPNIPQLVDFLFSQHFNLQGLVDRVICVPLALSSSLTHSFFVVRFCVLGRERQTAVLVTTSWRDYPLAHPGLVRWLLSETSELMIPRNVVKSKLTGPYLFSSMSIWLSTDMAIERFYTLLLCPSRYMRCEISTQSVRSSKGSSLVLF